MRQPKSSLSLEQKLTRARTQLLLNSPFFGALVLRLKLVCAPQSPTMATDGRRIVYNPTFVEGLTPAELEGVFAHEVLHCALGHHCRRGNRDPKLFNEAADYAVNPLLLDNGMTLPAGALVDPAFANLSAEEIYARLVQKQGQPSGSSSTATGAGDRGTTQVPHNGGQPQSQPTGAQPSAPQPGNTSDGAPDMAPAPRPGGFGEVMDATAEDGGPASEAELSRQAHEWRIAVEQAVRSAKACGRWPGGLERHLADAKVSRTQWRSVLRDFISSTDPSDYRWTPPNRRYVASGLYLPSVERSGMGEIVIAVDTASPMAFDKSRDPHRFDGSRQ